MEGKNFNVDFKPSIEFCIVFLLTILYDVIFITVCSHMYVYMYMTCDFFYI